MDAFLISTLVVAVGEIGDKTQLLALLLAARFRRPIPILFGILFATLANHTLAGFVGEWVRAAVGDAALQWILGFSFIAIAVWALVPDKLDEDESPRGSYGVFAVTLVAFFMAEIGDKTQIATVMLAAKYHALANVVAGTTLGMMIADVPAVLIGNFGSAKIPFKLIRYTAASIFAVMGLIALARAIG